MPHSTLTVKGQVTLPKPIREKLGVGPGDRVDFRATKEGEVVVEAATRDLRHLRGILKAPGAGVTVEQMNETIRAEGSKM